MPSRFKLAAHPKDDDHKVLISSYLMVSASRIEPDTTIFDSLFIEHANFLGFLNGNLNVGYANQLDYGCDAANDRFPPRAAPAFLHLACAGNGPEG